MRKFSFLVLTYFFLLTSNPVQAQKDKYKVIQGFGYLHTQVSMLLNHWEKHPLNHKATEEQEAKLQEHIIAELEHDEEWVEFMMVEESLSHFEGNLDASIKKIIHENLQFYHAVLTHLRKPEEIDEKLKEWREQFKIIQNNLYNQIFPVLCK